MRVKFSNPYMKIKLSTLIYTQTAPSTLLEWLVIEEGKVHGKENLFSPVAKPHVLGERQTIAKVGRTSKITLCNCTDLICSSLCHSVSLSRAYIDSGAPPSAGRLALNLKCDTRKMLIGNIGDEFNILHIRHWCNRRGIMAYQCELS